MAVQKGGDRVVVLGLSDFRRALKALDDTSLTDQLKAANRNAAQIVVDRAAPSMASAGGIGVRLAHTMKAGNVQTRGQLSLSSVRVRGRSFLPLGVEFGAMRNMPRTVVRAGQAVTVQGWNQFRPWRRNGADAGYHIYPALRAEQSRIIDVYGDELDRLYRKAFPE